MKKHTTGLRRTKADNGRKPFGANQKQTAYAESPSHALSGLTVSMNIWDIDTILQTIVSRKMAFMQIWEKCDFRWNSYNVE